MRYPFFKDVRTAPSALKVTRFTAALGASSSEADEI
jgi:hypothetical protein